MIDGDEKKIILYVFSSLKSYIFERLFCGLFDILFSIETWQFIVMVSWALFLWNFNVGREDIAPVLS